MDAGRPISGLVRDIIIKNTFNYKGYLDVSLEISVEYHQYEWLPRRWKIDVETFGQK